MLKTPCRRSSFAEAVTHTAHTGRSPSASGALNSRPSPFVSEPDLQLHAADAPARRVTNAAANSIATIRSKASGKTKKYLAMMAP